MRSFAAIPTLIMCLQMLVFAFPQKQLIWREQDALRLEVVKAQTDSHLITLTVRFSNLGPDPVYVSERVGTEEIASMRVEELRTGKWKRISVPSDVRARCSEASPSAVVSQVIAIERHVLTDPGPSKVRVGVVAYHTLDDCSNARNGGLVFSFPEDLGIK